MPKPNVNRQASAAEMNAALNAWKKLPTRQDIEARIAQEEFEAERSAEMAWLRHAENATWMEAAMEEQYDYQRGVY
jgi:hypothetical protein